MARAIYYCKHCGERMEGKDTEVKNFCARCKSAEGRRSVDAENEEIKNAKKSA